MSCSQLRPGNPERSAARIIANLRSHGAVAEHVAVAPLLPGIDVAREVENPKWIELVRGARGVYFAGGAQERIVDTLMPGGKVTPLLQAVWDVYRSGGVVAGSSAGAAIMSATMIRDGEDMMSLMKGSIRPGKEIDRGLGFVGDGLFTDQHFLRRGRIGRLLPVMVATGYTRGLGVEENTAAIVHNDEVEVVGAGGALYRGPRRRDERREARGLQPAWRAAKLPRSRRQAESRDRRRLAFRGQARRHEARLEGGGLQAPG